MSETNSAETTFAETVEAETVPTIIISKSIAIEIEFGKTLNINPNLIPAETKQLIKLLADHKEEFSSEYTYMKVISSELCTHHIYIKNDSWPICQPQ